MKNEPPNLDNVLFPVVLADVVVPNWKKPGELFVGQLSTHHKAVIDVQRNRVLSVVTDKYRLVENREAIARGESVFKRIFSESTVASMELFNVTVPETRSFCHVDYTLKGYSFHFGSEDEWQPFLRITNSYNRTKPLRFDFGFCRAFCRNGMIFDPRQATIKRYHSGILPDIEDLSGLDLRAIKSMEVAFIERLKRLRRYAVPPDMMLPTLCKVFDINITKEQISKPKAELRVRAFGNCVTKLTNKYFDELGHNGYAALNVLTDFATRPEHTGFSTATHMHSMQVRSALWVDEYINEIKSEDFDYQNYIAKYADSANTIRSTLSSS